MYVTSHSYSTCSNKSVYLCSVSSHCHLYRNVHVLLSREFYIQCMCPSVECLSATVWLFAHHCRLKSNSRVKGSAE